jgi:hypothetical protein
VGIEAGPDDTRVRRIIALLVAFAGLAERAAGRCFPIRFLVFVVLWRAEAVARDCVEGVLEAAGLCLDDPLILAHAPDGAALAARFRLLAEILDALPLEWVAAADDAGPRPGAAKAGGCPPFPARSHACAAAPRPRRSRARPADPPAAPQRGPPARELRGRFTDFGCGAASRGPATGRIRQTVPASGPRFSHLDGARPARAMRPDADGVGKASPCPKHGAETRGQFTDFRTQAAPAGALAFGIR